MSRRIIKWINYPWPRHSGSSAAETSSERMPKEVDRLRLYIEPGFRQLTRDVIAANIPCTCDQYRPDLYHSHSHLKVDLSGKTNEWRKTNYGWRSLEIYKTPILQSIGRYDAMDLARKSIEYSMVPFHKMNGNQIRDVRQFCELLSLWGHDLDVVDASKVPAVILNEFMRCIFDIFFFGSIVAPTACVWSTDLYKKTALGDTEVKIRNRNQVDTPVTQIKLKGNRPQQQPIRSTLEMLQTKESTQLQMGPTIIGFKNRVHIFHPKA